MRSNRFVKLLLLLLGGLAVSLTLVSCNPVFPGFAENHHVNAILAMLKESVEGFLHQNSRTDRLRKVAAHIAVGEWVAGDLLVGSYPRAVQHLNAFRNKTNDGCDSGSPLEIGTSGSEFYVNGVAWPRHKKYSKSYPKGVELRGTVAAVASDDGVFDKVIVNGVPWQDSVKFNSVSELKIDSTLRPVAYVIDRSDLSGRVLTDSGLWKYGFNSSRGHLLDLGCEGTIAIAGSGLNRRATRSSSTVQVDSVDTWRIVVNDEPWKSKFKSVSDLQAGCKKHVAAIVEVADGWSVATDDVLWKSRFSAPTSVSVGMSEHNSSVMAIIGNGDSKYIAINDGKPYGPYNDITFYNIAPNDDLYYLAFTDVTKWGWYKNGLLVRGGFEEVQSVHGVDDGDHTIIAKNNNRWHVYSSTKEWDFVSNAKPEIVASTKGALAVAMVTNGLARIVVNGMPWNTSFLEVKQLHVNLNGIASALVLSADGKRQFVLNDKIVDETFDTVFSWVTDENALKVAAAVGDRQSDGQLKFRVVVREVAK